MSVFILSGCTKSSSNETLSDTSSESVIVEEKVFALENIVWEPACDAYMSTLQCIVAAGTGTDYTALGETYDSLLQSFDNMPVEQLNAICTDLSDSLRTHPTLLSDHADCNFLQ